MLRVTDLSVNYGNVRALRSLSLEVRTGQLVAVVGPNGAGKSTALLAMVGMVAKISGSVHVDGVDITRASPRSIVRAGVSLVPESRNIFGSLTVEENLIVGSSSRKRTGDIRSDLAAQMERFPVLGQRRHQSGGTLSGGEQQQLAIARALMARPKLLLLDEPSLGLAPLVVNEVFDALESLRDDGTTIVLVEQNAGRAISVADHAYVLRGGTVTLSGRGNDLSSSLLLEDEYLGRRRSLGESA